jgi:hypothetical protein
VGGCVEDCVVLLQLWGCVMLHTARSAQRKGGQQAKPSYTAVCQAHVSQEHGSSNRTAKLRM